MSDTPVDFFARERFRLEWTQNFAVSANAGSGKTTAISERLATMALSAEAAEIMPKTAVVTFTKKAANQIAQRARSVLLRRIREAGRIDVAPLDRLERVFFGTIHSFCLLLARRYGQSAGVHLNPEVLPENDDSVWQQFIEQDAMVFKSLPSAAQDAFGRHVPLETIFELARMLDLAAARRLVTTSVPVHPPIPSSEVLEKILTFPARGTGKKNIERCYEVARRWAKVYGENAPFLPLCEPVGASAGMVALFDEWMAPLKKWLAEAGAILAAELALRYRAFRIEHAVQTYADQVEAATALLSDAVTIDRIRQDGWRIILDEAQDTDEEQFRVLVEITRPSGAELGTWPLGRGAAPRAGHFCMVGDGQQAIYGARADIRNFVRHIEAFCRGDCGELLTFQVTFRTPERVIEFLNRGLPLAFSAEQPFNLGLPPAEGASAPCLQVQYAQLAAAPSRSEGDVWALPLRLPESPLSSVHEWMREEARQVALWLKEHGPEACGAARWSELCLLAPRNDWLIVARQELEAVGLRVALQMRKVRNSDNPAYAWLSSLLSVLCDPENTFEWFGVLREIFAVDDAALAEALRGNAGLRWEEPEAYTGRLREALTVLRPWVLQVDDEGLSLHAFVSGLMEACELHEKAQHIDPTGVLSGELERLQAEALSLAGEGVGPRDWLRSLLRALDEGRPAGRADEDAVQLLTSYSAKGLEWPVVIPLGLWRGIGKAPENGLRVLRDADGSPRVFFDSASLPEEAREARERERIRELVRLMYVTLTRAQRNLIFPWTADFGGKQRIGPSFAELWGNRELLGALPVLDGRPLVKSALRLPAVAARAPESTEPRLLAPLPRRLLPHELIERTDAPRVRRHEASAETPSLALARDEAIAYGLWWHETMEFMPWSGEKKAVDRHIEGALTAASNIEARARAERELVLLRESPAWREINSPGWVRQAELGVFAPLQTDAWMDGVVDLSLQSGERREIWVIDWKTNTARPGEKPSALVDRLLTEYTGQLNAYSTGVARFFPGYRVRTWIYASAAGEWGEWAAP